MLVGQSARSWSMMISRAYFYAKMTRPLYIEIPSEDPKASPELLGRLRLCLYGIRDAALNWQQTLSDHLVENGFVRGVGHPSVFHHSTRDIWILVHGVDYCSAGTPADRPGQEVRDQDAEDRPGQGQDSRRTCA
jgi:hypothetical protein